MKQDNNWNEQILTENNLFGFMILSLQYENYSALFLDNAVKVSQLETKTSSHFEQYFFLENLSEFSFENFFME